MQPGLPEGLAAVLSMVRGDSVPEQITLADGLCTCIYVYVWSLLKAEKDGGRKIELNSKTDIEPCL